MKTNNKGFSLVELIVVIAIMAILAAVAIPTFAGFITKANKASDDDFMNAVQYAVDLSNAADPTYAASTITVTVSGGKATQIAYGSSVEVASTDKPAAGVAPTSIEGEIASMIDWDYNFKYYKNGTVTITTADVVAQGS